MLDPAAFAAWEDYESGCPQAAAEDIDLLRRKLARRGWEHLFPPPILTAETAREVEGAARSILELIRSIPARFFDDDCREWTRFLGIAPKFADLLCHCFATSPREIGTLFCRPDFLVTEAGLRLVEYNISTPMGGMNTADPYARAFEASGYARFLGERGVAWRGFDLSRAWSTAIARFTPRPRPRACPLLFEAAANPEERAARHPALVALTTGLGYSLISGLITELSVERDGVYIDHHRVDTVFTMFTWAELVAHVPVDTVLSLMDAAQRGLITFVSPPLHALFDSKANLELLTHEKYASFWSADERQLIADYVLPTYRLTPDAIAFARDDRNRLVLKPCAQFAGRGVIIGASASQAEWESAIERCASPSVTHIVQQAAPAPGIVRRAGPDGPADYAMSLGPVLFGDELAGIFVRQKKFAGETPIINAKAGAEAGMAYVVSD
jgi:glutathionylspermidine synthase